MSSYLLDSGLLYGFIDDADSHHKSAIDVFKDISGSIIFPVPAITEVSYFIKRNLGVKRLANFLIDLSDTSLLLETPELGDYLRTAEILRKYNDINIDFVDALIFAMAERLNITKILTVDRRHFQIFRPKHCEVFDILP